MGRYIFVIRCDDCTIENYNEMKQAIEQIIKDKKAYLDTKQYIEE